MWIIQYMGLEDNFWKTLVFPKGKELDMLNKLDGFHDAGFITRLYKRVDISALKEEVEL